MPHCSIPLSFKGAFLQCFIGQSTYRAEAFKQAGTEPPAPIPVYLQIDTGADSTVIDNSILEKLQLIPTGSKQVLTPSTGSKSVTLWTYDIAIYISGIPGTDHPIKSIQNLQVSAADFAAQGINGLLGRDVLQTSRMFYSGPDNLVMLTVL